MTIYKKMHMSCLSSNWIIPKDNLRDNEIWKHIHFASFNILAVYFTCINLLICNRSNFFFFYLADWGRGKLRTSDTFTSLVISCPFSAGFYDKRLWLLSIKRTRAHWIFDWLCIEDKKKQSEQVAQRKWHGSTTAVG